MTHSTSGFRAFPASRWSSASHTVDGAARKPAEALDELGGRYRYPVYAYLRCCGHSPAIAFDITQGFLHHLRRSAGEMSACARHRQFRGFLIARLHAWLAGDWRDMREHADNQATGEDRQAAKSDLEARFERERPHAASPEQAFQRGFALEVLARAFDRLRAEARQTGHLDMYEALACHIGADPGPGRFDELSRTLHMRPLAVVVALTRLRQRLRELADEELADTVSSADELPSEQQALLNILQRVE